MLRVGVDGDAADPPGRTGRWVLHLPGRHGGTVDQWSTERSWTPLTVLGHVVDRLCLLRTTVADLPTVVLDGARVPAVAGAEEWFVFHTKKLQVSPCRPLQQPVYRSHVLLLGRRTTDAPHRLLCATTHACSTRTR